MASVTLDALADRCWILIERRLQPPLYDAVIRLAETKKIAPSRIQHITTPKEAYQPLINRSAVAFLLKPGRCVWRGMESLSAHWRRRRLC